MAFKLAESSAWFLWRLSFIFVGSFFPVAIEAFVVIVLVGFCFVLEVSWILSFAAYGAGEGRLGSRRWFHCFFFW